MKTAIALGKRQLAMKPVLKRPASCTGIIPVAKRPAGGGNAGGGNAKKIPAEDNPLDKNRDQVKANKFREFREDLLVVVVQEYEKANREGQ